MRIGPRAFGSGRRCRSISCSDRRIALLVRPLFVPYPLRLAPGLAFCLRGCSPAARESPESRDLGRPRGRRRRIRDVCGARRGAAAARRRAASDIALALASVPAVSRTPSTWRTRCHARPSRRPAARAPPMRPPGAQKTQIIEKRRVARRGAARGPKRAGDATPAQPMCAAARALSTFWRDPSSTKLFKPNETPGQQCVRECVYFTCHPKTYTKFESFGTESFWTTRSAVMKAVVELVIARTEDAKQRIRVLAASGSGDGFTGQGLGTVSAGCSAFILRILSCSLGIVLLVLAHPQ